MLAFGANFEASEAASLLRKGLRLHGVDFALSHAQRSVDWVRCCPCTRVLLLPSTSPVRMLGAVSRVELETLETLRTAL